MSDEELEQKCSNVLDRMMYDDRYFLHMIFKAFTFRVEKITKEELKDGRNR